MKKTILIILFIITFVFAKGEWSEPVLVAAPETGVANQNCQIAVDCNGVLHAVFTEMFTVEYKNLKYSQSTDGGKTWSTQISLTPNNTDERVNDPRIVIDSENNVHIIFYYLDAVNPIYYLNNSGGSWSDPVYLGIGMTSVPMFEIDQDDRLYIAFFSGDVSTGKSYYVYKDKSGDWTTPATIPGINGDGRLLDLFSYNSYLYAVGSDFIPTKYESLARLYRYDKNLESWTDAIDISCGSSSSSGRSIYVTDNDTVHVVISESTEDNMSIYLKSSTDLNSWSEPDTASVNTVIMSKYKFIYINGDNNVQIIEGNPEGIIHTYKIEDSWANDIPHPTTMGHSSTFDGNDTIFLILSYDNNVYFMSKSTTGIEVANNNIINDYFIEQIYPNPFNNQTTIVFNLKENAKVKINLYNSNGQLVQVILNKKYIKGKHQYIMNTNSINSGIYYCRMIVDGVFKDSKKVVYLK